MRSLITYLVLFTLSWSVLCQNTQEKDPNKAQFEATDIQNFWAAFDEFNSEKQDSMKAPSNYLHSCSMVY